MEIINHTPFVVEALPFNNIMLLIVKGTFEMQTQKIAAEQIPIAFADEFNDGGSIKFESDIVPFKPRTDIVLNGKAYAPHGKKVKRLKTSLTVDKVSKTLIVTGDRYWQTRAGFVTASEPEPFSEMEIAYERGYIDSKKSIKDCPLPNIEDPNYLIKSWKDKPKPAGYGFISKSSPSRVKYLGTYDEKWQKEIAPNPPNDFKMDFYNAAPEELQMPGYLKGNENVELVNLMPEGLVNFKLPTYKLKIQLEREEITTMNLDTLCLLPDEKKFYLVWRGNVPIDIEKIIVSGVL